MRKTRNFQNINFMSCHLSQLTLNFEEKWTMISYFRVFERWTGISNWSVMIYRMRKSRNTKLSQTCPTTFIFTLLPMLWLLKTAFNSELSFRLKSRISYENCNRISKNKELLHHVVAIEICCRNKKSKENKKKTFPDQRWLSPIETCFSRRGPLRTDPLLRSGRHPSCLFSDFRWGTAYSDAPPQALRPRSTADVSCLASGRKSAWFAATYRWRSRRERLKINFIPTENFSLFRWLLNKSSSRIR